jgi:hypothetical protein
MRSIGALVSLALVTLSGAAFAQDEIPVVAPAVDAATVPAGDGPAAVALAPEAVPAPAVPAGLTYVSRGLTVGAGALQVTAPVVLNLSKNEVLKPVWIPLDVRFGVTDHLDVFLSHNSFGLPLAFRGGGVCIGGKDRNCLKLYDNLNLGAELSLLKDAGIELSGIGALELRSLDPAQVAIDLGIGFKFRRGPVAIKAAPQIGLAVNKRDRQPKTFVAAPVQLALQATHAFAVFMDTGVFGPTDDFSRAYAIPVGVGAAFAVMPILDVGAELMLPLVLAGKDDNKPFDARTLMLYAALRTK